MVAGAGFADVTFTDVREMYFGPDVAAAPDWVRGYACTSDVLNRVDPAAAARALGRLRTEHVAPSAAAPRLHPYEACFKERR